MWNISSSPNNFYFGANFVDYIGHIDNNLVMVKPANGQGYDSFIFSQYFDTVVQGSTAATAATLNVIALIEALPQNITLSDEEAVVAARAAYNALPSTEQQALVSNYSKLVEAERLIDYLKPVVPTEPEESVKLTFWQEHFYIGYIIAGVAVIALVCYIVLNTMKKKSNTEVNADGEAENKEESTDEEK